MAIPKKNIVDVVYEEIIRHMSDAAAAGTLPKGEPKTADAAIKFMRNKASTPKLQDTPVSAPGNVVKALREYGGFLSHAFTSKKAPAKEIEQSQRNENETSLKKK